MLPAEVDLSLYLVTDPSSSNTVDIVEQALNNGATVIQLREKTLDTGALIAKAQRLHVLTRKARVPLIINDRVDVCLAMDAEGVHVGFDDMKPSTARRLIGDKILGVSVRDLDELRAVLEDGSADYIGIGAVYATSSKLLEKEPMGITGVSGLLAYLRANKIKTPSVIIGGLNLENSSRTIEEAAHDGLQTNGVAVVSCITGAQNPGEATFRLRESLDEVYGSIYAQMIRLRASPPVILHVTNTVVQNFSANVTLAIGASPIMSCEPLEYPDLAQLAPGAVVVNTGSPKITDTMFHEALKAYKQAGKQIVFDPVGIGATRFRRDLNSTLFKEFTPGIIKCNTAEILALVQECCGGEAITMRGVDSSVTSSAQELVRVIQPFCAEFNTIVAVTGPEDLVVDAHRHVKIAGGHEMMARVTGTGCSLGSVVAAFVAHLPVGDPSVFEGIVSALKCYKHCGLRAARVGPGSFQVAFLDELYGFKGKLHQQ